MDKEQHDNLVQIYYKKKRFCERCSRMVDSNTMTLKEYSYGWKGICECGMREKYPFVKKDKE